MILRSLVVALTFAGLAAAAPGSFTRQYSRVPLAQVLFELAVLSDLDVVIPGDVRGLVTMRFSAARPDEVFRSIVRAYDLEVRNLDGMTVVLRSRSSVSSASIGQFGALDQQLRQLKVSLTVQDVHVPDLLDTLSRSLDLAFVVRPLTGSRVSIRVRNLPLPSVLAGLAMGLRLSCETGCRMVVLSPISANAPARSR